jgi:hypothetical protein
MMLMANWFVKFSREGYKIIYFWQNSTYSKEIIVFCEMLKCFKNCTPK